MDPLGRRAQPIRKRKKRKPLSEEIRSTYHLLLVVLVLLGLGASGMYLYLNGLKSAKGYTLQQLESDFEALSSEQRALDHQVMEAQSFNKIQETEQIETMQESSSEDLTFLKQANKFAQSEPQD